MLLVWLISVSVVVGERAQDTCIFASCNRQNLPQDYWRLLGSFERAKTFLWTGDAVYAKSNSVSALEDAYSSLKGNSHYREFVRDRSVYGVWDDHDYGVNDGGNLVPGRKQRKELYLEFINSTSSADQNREGLYKTFTIGSAPVEVRFILLDTRYHRDSHWVRSVGEFPIPFSALMAAFVRLAYITLGLGRDHTGDVLGTPQWEWLVNVLSNSKSDFHVIVSSTQIFTTNPIVESWGHFPEAKRRLVDLLIEADPSGLVFISGDVHLAELSRAVVTRKDGRQFLWTEVTSSGLTHTCADSMVTSAICPAMMQTFTQHREDADDFYIGTNFGVIRTFTSSNCTTDLNLTLAAQAEECSSSQDARMEVAVYSLSDVPPRPVLTHTVYSSNLDSQVLNEIVSVEYFNFPYLQEKVAIDVIICAIALLFCVVWSLARLFGLSCMRL